MSWNNKVQVIKEAIKQVMEEEEEEEGNDDDDRLSKLMSQLEKLEEGEPSSSSSSPAAAASLLKSTRSSEEEEERMMKELKKVKRQNVITHCLVSALILLTVAWQISEVSIILKLKDGVAHPFRSLGAILTSIIKPKPKPIQDDIAAAAVDDAAAADDIESTHTAHQLKLPHLHLPKIDFP